MKQITPLSRLRKSFLLYIYHNSWIDLQPIQIESKSTHQQRNIKMKISKILFILSFLSLAQFARAENFVVGVEELDYLPFYTNSGGNYSGAAKEIMDAFAKKKGHTFSYKAMPINRLLQSVLSGEVDFKFPDNDFWAKDAKGSAKIVYSTAVFNTKEGAMVLPKRKDATEIKSLGTILGFTAFPFLDLIKSKKIELSENPDIDNLVKQGLAERVEGLYLNVDVANYRLKEMGKEGALVLAEKLPMDKTEFKMSSVKNPKIIAEFSEFLKSDAAAVAEIKAKFGLK